MTAALVPSAQLRMRSSTGSGSKCTTPAIPCSSPLHHGVSPLESKWDEEQRYTIEMGSASPSKSKRQSTVLSRVSTYFSMRHQHRHGHAPNNNRAATSSSLYSHPKEKSSFVEEPDVEDTFKLEKHYSLHQKGNGSNSNNTNNVIGETTLPSSQSSNDNSPFELWGVSGSSIILLNLVAIIYGTQHSVIKSVVDDTVISLGTGLNLEQMGINLSSLQQTSAASLAAVGDTNTADEIMGSNAAYFTLARFGLAALFASAYTPGLSLLVNGDGDRRQSTLDRRQGDVVPPSVHVKDGERESVRLAWRYGAELGLYMFLGYAFQAIALETTTATRSGFLLYLNVKFVPFFSYFLFGKKIQTSTWISALAAFAGTGLLAFDNANNASGGGVDGGGLTMAFNVGDLWSIAAAAASALFILRMEAASKAVPKSAELNAANLWTVALLSTLWTLGISWKSVDAESTTALVSAMQQTFQQTLSTITSHPLALIYLAGVTTALANFLQSKAQKDVSAERASVIYAMDPVYGAIFANVLLGETLGGPGLVGAFVIFVAAATNAVMDFGNVNEGKAADKETR